MSEVVNSENCDGNKENIKSDVIKVPGAEKNGRAFGDGQNLVSHLMNKQGYSAALQSLIPEPTEEERTKFAEEVKRKAAETKDELPTFPDYPLADFVKEHKLDEKLEKDEFYADLGSEEDAQKLYKDMKNMPDVVCKKYYPDMCRRFIVQERRIKELEKMLWELPREDRSVQEDRFEILTELLDKVCKGFEIWDEHVERKISMGHRLVLESRLVHLIKSRFNIIETTCREFDKIGSNQDEADREREWIRYEIRHCDLLFTELHEAFLRSYLEMEWS
ncbi:hypothetical protein WR25_05268 [Diploscapter pachys]|uniref:Uncharacterized protein n=1 Tax=Diploscapter pachys TaxID=2018661 RepID=A0A2A2LSB5_9BILA|nr:hypothetical protein WR25_05268 [Diploscapter pachys]